MGYGTWPKKCSSIAVIVCAFVVHFVDSRGPRCPCTSNNFLRVCKSAYSLFDVVKPINSKTNEFQIINILFFSKEYFLRIRQEYLKVSKSILKKIRKQHLSFFVAE